MAKGPPISGSRLPAAVPSAKVQILKPPPREAPAAALTPTEQHVHDKGFWKGAALGGALMLIVGVVGAIWATTAMFDPVSENALKGVAVGAARADAAAEPLSVTPTGPPQKAPR